MAFVLWTSKSKTACLRQGPVPEQCCSRAVVHCSRAALFRNSETAVPGEQWPPHGFSKVGAVPEELAEKLR